MVDSVLAVSPFGMGKIRWSTPGSTATGMSDWVTMATRWTPDGSTEASSSAACGPTSTGVGPAFGQCHLEADHWTAPSVAGKAFTTRAPTIETFNPSVSITASAAVS